MHQDQRVGLALGVLLVGACAAFFFRNETHSSSKAPQLQHAQELDDRIAERSTRPYLKGIQTVETADKRYSNQSADPAHSQDDQEDGFYTNGDSADGKLARSKQPRFQRPGMRSVGGSDDVLELAPITIPSDDISNGQLAAGTDSTLNHSSSAPHRGHSKSTDSASNSRTYVVQKGDTLSSIAAKTLGHSQRFQELYDANHDQLSDPNDVKVGMTLRIPDGRTDSTSVPHSTKIHAPANRDPEPIDFPTDTLGESAIPTIDAKSSLPERSDSPALLLPPELPRGNQFDLPDETEIPADSGSSRKFVPARRVPLPGRPAGPQARNSGQPEMGGRKLSQASLESTSGKVAR